MNAFGNRLKELRAQQELSLKNASEKVGIPPSRLVELEYGVRLPTEGQIQRLEVFYQLEPGTLAKLAETIELEKQW
jgi:transcriptional regulator with XRE-family HTH domain